ncbi:MAG: SIS domain-containing protein [Clostridiales bacterium]|nr:SIS domain-containing protein [Clostridiales bacterium]MDD7432577.1 SIS domain-containing protein [Clostridiales bacterium]MDY3062154.1 SIS domain-containing protein [Eubacteriales bacterium]
MQKREATFAEIQQQPEMWQRTTELWQQCRGMFSDFLEAILKRHGQLRVVLTGAGTSAYVGDILAPHLNRFADPRLHFEAIATTSLVSAPELFFSKEPTLLVSFARSGNSPESLAACEIARKAVTDLYLLGISCAAEGKLAQDLAKDPAAFLFLLDDRCNDRGFAMTSSFSSMLLAALLLFESADETAKIKKVESVCRLGQFALSAGDKWQELGEQGFSRVIYLGSGCLAALTREAQLKILELTAGRITTCFDSSMGFRHGPKSFVNEDSLVVQFVSPDPYTRQYDEDILAELRSDKIARRVFALAQKEEGDGLVFPAAPELEDAWLALPYVIPAQLIAACSARHIQNDVDNPSASGTVNRVVKGVSIHPWREKS